MDKVLNIIWEYRYIIMWIVIAVLYALTEWNGFKSKVTALMLDAKKLAKDGVLKNGEQQVEWIVLQAYQKLPKRYQLFKEETMKKVVKWLYDKAMDYIDDGQFNDSLASDNSGETFNPDDPNIPTFSEDIESASKDNEK